MIHKNHFANHNTHRSSRRAPLVAPNWEVKPIIVYCGTTTQVVCRAVLSHSCAADPIKLNRVARLPGLISGTLAEATNTAPALKSIAKLGTDN